MVVQIQEQYLQTSGKPAIGKLTADSLDAADNIENFGGMTYVPSTALLFDTDSSFSASPPAGSQSPHNYTSDYSPLDKKYPENGEVDLKQVSIPLHRVPQDAIDAYTDADELQDFKDLLSEGIELCEVRSACRGLCCESLI